MKNLSMNVDKILHGLMSNLIYPAVLGSIIYSFAISIFEFVVRPESFIFLTKLGVNSGTGFICLSIYSLLIIWHYCTDYLYTLHSPRNFYGSFNFACDITISGLLAISYACLVDSLSSIHGSAHYFQSAMTFSWFSMAAIYLIFLAWDVVGYKSFRPSQEYAKFYLSMVRPFEASGILVFIAMAVLCKVLTFPGLPMTAFAISSIAVYLFYTRWFWRKLMHYVRISSGQR